MNIVIVKQGAILGALLGALIGVVALINPLMIYVLFTLCFLCAPIVMIFMKKRNMLGYLDSQQGATLGGIIGFTSTLGFFILFIPLVLIIGVIFKTYYTYGIPYFINLQSLWLFLVIIVMIAATLAMTNAVMGMATTYIYNQIEPPPPLEEGNIDIEIDEEL